MPATGGDILLHIKSNRVDLCYELANHFYKSIPKYFLYLPQNLIIRDLIKDVEETFGYVYKKSGNFGKVYVYVHFLTRTRTSLDLKMDQEILLSQRKGKKQL